MSKKPDDDRETYLRVDELERERRALVSQLENFTACLQSSPIWLASCDRELRYTWFHSPHPDFEPSSVLGKTDRELTNSAGARALTRLKEKTLETGTSGRARVELPMQDGDYTFDILATPILDDAGQVTGVRTTAIDITTQVGDRRRSELMAARADEANQAKDEFLAMLGHELRNPLAPILTALQLMRMAGNRSRELDVIERQVGHLTRLVDDLLDISRITQARIELRTQPVELSDIILRAVETVSPLLEGRQHRLDLRVPASGLGVEVDSDRMTQVISNLLTNACKYSPIGSRIVIEAEAGPGEVVLRVIDEGRGIDRDMLEEIFDLFTQQGQSMDRAEGGLGLGLTIVRSLVELHGGRVEAESAGPGRGTTMTVALPRVELDLDLENFQQVSEHAGSPPAPDDDGGKLRVLVIDDNDDAAETLAMALEAIGYRVAVAHDGPTALDVAEEFRPHAALVDIGLPVMDGYELAQRLREQIDGGQNLRLVAVTGYGQESDKRRSREAGFDAHLVKPVSLADIEAML